MSFEKTVEQLAIPTRTLGTLSFCEPVPKHMSEWISHLPMVNLGESSRQLYHAIIELNQLNCDFDTRIALLEILRKPTVSVCGALSKHYLNQPLILPDKARKIARLAIALNNHLAIGYKIAVNEYSKTKNLFAARKTKKSAALAVHRAMSALNQNILRFSQLYTRVPDIVWEELHQFYLIGESNKLLDISIDDTSKEFLTKSTIADIYKQGLTLGCCKPNQMQQQDIKKLFDATEYWSQHINVGPVTNLSKYIIDLGGDKPPIHRDFTEHKKTAMLRGIDFADLLKLLQQFLRQAGATGDAYVKGITVPRSVTEDLVRYLIKTWGSVNDRAANRVANDKMVKLCVGFSATHYFVAGGVDFETQTNRDEAGAGDPDDLRETFRSANVKSISDVEDRWAGGFDVNNDLAVRSAFNTSGIDYRAPESKQEVAEEAPTEHGYITYEARILDSSPFGYCIKWLNDVPAEIKTGEIIGVSEGSEHTWSIGVIRWLNQLAPEETLIGVEIVAPNAIPCGVKVLMKGKRKSEYIRALIMPPLDQKSSYPNLITPNLPFREGLKVIVNQYGEIRQGILADRETLTSRFSRFVFETELTAIAVDDDDGDSEDIWPDI